ncbi:ectoine/hydroxyectoine ABC transporter substrate-binding protein EhuB [Mesorhizobium sp. M1312]|uniref:ectoine/hydroxyectoine ABC transporter substrate-binding protein EhuB n=1 Tax=unclassified Mesorhizobium TaxID=325217 RepID=UPI0033378E71
MMDKIQRRFSRFGRLLFTLAVTAAAPCFAVAQTLEQAKSDGVTIAIANEPPYAFMGADGSPTGAGPELDKAILGEVGITRFSGQVMEYGAMIPAVQSRRATFASSGSLMITPQRCEAVIYSEPLICDGGSFVLSNKLADTVKSVKDLAAAGATVAVCGGCVAQQLALKAGIPTDKIIIFPDAPSGLKLLTDGRVDVYFHDTLATPGLFEKLVDKSKFKYLPVPDFPIGCQAAAFNKDDVALRDAYNDGIKKVRESGKYMEILKKFKMEAAAFGIDTATAEQLCKK